MPVWTIAGESGQPLNATARTPEQLGAEAGSLTTGAMEGDRLQLTCALAALDGSTYPIPAAGQRVTVRADGNVVFRGWVSKREVSIDEPTSPKVSIEVAGPDWLLQRLPLSGTATDGTGAAATRHQFALGAASLSSMLGSIIARATALFPSGQSPCQIGTVDASYTLPQQTLSGTSVLDALIQVLRMVPDAIAWWEYQAGTHQAKLMVSRRGSRGTISLAFGPSGTVKSARINPRLDWQATDGVVIDYAQMVTSGPQTGQPQYVRQTSAGATARAQIVTTTGPENVAFLPENRVANETLTTIGLNSTAELAVALSNFYQPTRDILTRLGSIGTTIADARLARTDGGALPAGALYALWAGNFQEWMRDQGIPYYACKLSGKLFRSWRDVSSGFENGVRYVESTDRGGNPNNQPQVFRLTAAQIAFVDIATQTITRYNYPFPYQNSTYLLYTYSLPCEVDIMVSPLPFSGQTIYKAPDYQFIAPPANLASNLAAAQNFTPYEGTITLRDSGWTAVEGKLVQITGGLPEWATMTALVTARSADLFTDIETITVGAPARLGHLNLVNRVPTSPQDNIRYL